MKNPLVFGVYARPKDSRTILWFLGAIPFLLFMIGYYIIALERHEVNPKEKLMPLPTQMIDKFSDLATEPSKRTGEILLVQDTVTSVKRIVVGMILSAVVGLTVGLSMGLFPGIGALLGPVITFTSNIVPTALLPLLLIILGVGDASKIGLIFLGTVFIITRTIYADTLVLRKQITKSLTLGASQLQIGYEIMLPQLMPRLIDALKLTLGAAWIFLVAAEAIAGTEGLGYRIFLVRRYMAMDLIIPYVLWITVLAIGMDTLLTYIRNKLYPWYKAEQG